MKRTTTGLILGTAAGTALYFYARRSPASLTRLTCRSPRLPVDFDGYKILLVSDLHGREFGAHQKQLLSLAEEASPDCIAVTGDLIQDEHTRLAAVMDFMAPAAELAPVYFTPGNHEYRCGAYLRLRGRLKAAGIHLLEDRSVRLQRGDSSIALIGLRDPDFWNDSFIQHQRAGFYQNFRALLRQTDGQFRIILCHRPELFAKYVRNGVDLALAGHAHGGQIRLPFGGFIAPDQGFFPAYTQGLYQRGLTSMAVSRGLGDSTFLPRVCNRPELVLITLRCVQRAKRRE